MISMTSRKPHGFTIVELLIVIVVIATLAAISILAYNGVQTRAKASSTTRDLKNVSRAFQLYAIDKDRSDWWIDNSPDLTGSSNPQISAIITTQPGFRQYLSNLSAGSGSSVWTYDNDLDTYTGCSATSTAGTNIFVTNFESSVAQLIDNNIDDGNLSCGRITYNPATTTLRYNLGATPGAL